MCYTNNRRGQGGVIILWPEMSYNKFDLSTNDRLVMEMDEIQDKEKDNLDDYLREEDNEPN